MTGGEISELAKGFQPPLHRRRGQLTGLGITLPQTRGGLFGLDDPKRAQLRINGCHQKMKGIGPDIDGGDPTLISVHCLRRAVVLFRWLGWGLGIQHQRQSGNEIHSDTDGRGHQALTRVLQIPLIVISSSARLQPWIELLRWNKPTGRLILLIPAGWALWLNPSAPPSVVLILQILLGGLAVSGAGCIANDLWDQRFDGQVERTQHRPLARGALQRGPAFALLLILLGLSLAVVLSLPAASLGLCLALACTAVLPILGYPSAKRWFAFPQAVLALCWGFAVLIPWAAATASLSGSPALVCSWLATVVWTFGFDTVYAMADRRDDARLGLRSSALSLGSRVVPVVRGCYLVTAITLAIAAWSAQIPAPFWPLWLLAAVFMQLSCNPLNKQDASMGTYGKHFAQQVQAGTLLWLGLVLARGWGA